MKQNTATVTVNGQRYDTATGLPVRSTPDLHAVTSRQASKSVASTPTSSVTQKNDAPETRKPAKAVNLHTPQGKSTTLRRSSVKRQVPSAPATTKKTNQDIILRKKSPRRHVSSTAKHRSITKFTAAQQAKTEAPDITPRTHPHAIKAQKTKTAPAKHTQTNKTRTLPSKMAKEVAIAKALNESKPTTPQNKRPRPRTKHRRAIRIIATVTLGLIIIATIVWIYLPKLSVTLASSQSGISATIPSFRPDGYRLQLPITAHDNQVVMTFTSNQNESSFTLTQEKSAWDSQAVRASVERESDGQFLTTNDRGLTIYTFNGNAAWVNRGILYRISGDSYLSNDTILRVASSL